jgi:hypothetical protein
MSDARIPPMALALGVGGLFPFVTCAGAVVLKQQLPVLGDPARALLAYGAVILSFLGGVRWGLALRLEESRFRSRQFVISVVPSIAAWLALMLAPGAGFGLMAGLFIILWAEDRSLAAAGAPPWYPRLRLLLTAVVVVALTGAAIAGIAA